MVLVYGLLGSPLGGVMSVSVMALAWPTDAGETPAPPGYIRRGVVAVNDGFIGLFGTGGVGDIRLIIRCGGKVISAIQLIGAAGEGSKGRRG